MGGAIDIDCYNSFIKWVWNNMRASNDRSFFFIYVNFPFKRKYAVVTSKEEYVIFMLRYFLLFILIHKKS